MAERGNGQSCGAIGCRVKPDRARPDVTREMLECVGRQTMICVDAAAEHGNSVLITETLRAQRPWNIGADVTGDNRTLDLVGESHGAIPGIRADLAFRHPYRLAEILVAFPGQIGIRIGITLPDAVINGAYVIDHIVMMRPDIQDAQHGRVVVDILDVFHLLPAHPKIAGRADSAVLGTDDLDAVHAVSGQLLFDPLGLGNPPCR
jgi:hypothetical protein